MAKKSKKRSLTTNSSTKWSDLPWNKISTHSEINEEAFHTSKNHYDNPKASSKDLYDPSSSHKSIDFVDGANDPGVFLGLEVIDGSSYNIEKIKIQNEVSGEIEGYVSRLVVHEKSEKKETAKSTTTGCKKSDDKKKESKKKETRDTPTTTHTKAAEDMTAEPEVPEKKMTRKERNKLKLKQMKEKRKELQREKRKLREEGASDATTKEQSKKKKKKQSQPQPTEIIKVSRQEMESIRVPWSIATGGVYLHPNLCESLYRLGFTSPTPIQSSTLAASILGQRDIVGAAPTGSVRTILRGLLLCLLFYV